MLGLHVLGTATIPRKQRRAQDGLLDSLGPLYKMNTVTIKYYAQYSILTAHGRKIRDGKLQPGDDDDDDEKYLFFR